MSEVDPELEELRRRRLAQLQGQAQQQEVVEHQQVAQETQRQNMLRGLLTEEARARLGRIKTARPDLAGTIEDQLIMLAQSGRIGTVIDDTTLLKLLDRLMPEKREIKIERR